jgi:hypothetical protein
MQLDTHTLLAQLPGSFISFKYAKPEDTAVRFRSHERH